MTNQIQIVKYSYITAINILIASISIRNELWSAETFSFTSSQLFQTWKCEWQELEALRLIVSHLM